MLAYVKRTTIKISDELDARLRQEAERTGRTISDVTRDALGVYLGTDGRQQLSFAKAGRSGRRDVSERIEEILRAEVAE